MLVLCLVKVTVRMCSYTGEGPSLRSVLVSVCYVYYMVCVGECWISYLGMRVLQAIGRGVP